MIGLYRAGDPLSARFTAFSFDPDAGMPFWAVSVLQWIGMVTAMQGASGKIGNNYREMAKQAADGDLMHQQFVNTRTGKTSWMSGPAAVYAVYQQFCLAIEVESRA